MMSRSAILLICYLGVASAFAPMSLTHAARSSRSGHLSMTLAPERVATSKGVNLAKQRAVEANKAQWGITEPLAYTPSATPAAAAAPKTSSASKGVNKAKANTLSANKAQWGITEPLAYTPSAAPAAAAPKTSSASKGVNKAKANALKANEEQWGITAPLSADGAAAPAAKAFRRISKDEARALVRQLNGMDKPQALAALQSFGYSGALLDQAWGMVAQARANSAPSTEYEKLFQEAEAFVAKSTATLIRADKLQAEAKQASSKITSELEPKVRELSTKIEEAEANVQSWGWVPFSNAKESLEALQQEQEELKKQIGNLNVAAAEGEAGSEALKAASKNELREAENKRMEAMRLRATVEGAEKTAAMTKLEARIQQWESLISQGNKAEVKAALSSDEVQDIFLTLALVPSIKYGASSLPGRVWSVVDAVRDVPAAGSKAGVTRGGLREINTEAQEALAKSTNGVLIGGVIAALLGAGAYYATHYPMPPMVPH